MMLTEYAVQWTTFCLSHTLRFLQIMWSKVFFFQNYGPTWTNVSQSAVIGSMANWNPPAALAQVPSAPQSILYVNMFVRNPKHSLMQRIVRCISLPCIEFLINIHTSGRGSGIPIDFFRSPMVVCHASGRLPGTVFVVAALQDVILSFCVFKAWWWVL